MFNRELKWEKIVLAKKVGDGLDAEEIAAKVAAAKVAAAKVAAAEPDKRVIKGEIAKDAAAGPEKDNYFFTNIIYNGKKKKSSQKSSQKSAQ
jgi:hypothetical protein